MIDGIKFTTYHFDIDSLVHNEKLDFTPNIAPRSLGGVILGYHTKLNNELYVKITMEFEKDGQLIKLQKPKLEIQNSLHKYKDNRNDTDFNFEDVCYTIDKLCNILCLEPSKCYVHTLEFGVNIRLSLKPKEVFNKYISYHQKAFVSFKDVNANAKFNGVKCSLSQFGIKIYDKGTQYQRHENIMRFECQVIKMQYLEKKNVFVQTLSDLKNKDTYRHLSEILVGLHNDILKVNKCNTSCMKPKEKVLFDNGQNIKYWEQKKNGTNRNTVKMTLKRQKKRFDLINEKYKTDNRHIETEHLLKEKCNELITKNVPLFTNFQTTNKYRNVPFFTFRINVNRGTFNPLPKYY